MQKGFSPLIAVIILAIVGIGAGGVWWFTQQVSETQDTVTSEETASTSPSATVAKETASKGKGLAKTKVKACDVLSLSKVSSIVGVPMSYTPGLTEEEKAYQDDELWNSLCSYTETNGTVESNAGVMVMISEGLSSEAKTFIKNEFENTKTADGGITLTGFGDKAYKIVDDSGFGVTSYYVMVGNMMITAYSAVGKGEMVGERADLTGVEKKDAETEAILKHILSQLQ